MSELGLKNSIEVEFPENLKLSVILKIRDNLNEPSSISLLDIVQKILKKGFQNFIFDLSKVNSVSSSGLGIISYCQQEITFFKGRLILICDNEIVLKLFQLTELDRFVQLVNNIEEAEKLLTE